MKKAKVLLALVFSLVFIAESVPTVVVNAAEETTVVYVTKTGEKYHSEGCRYLKKSKIEKSLEDAIDEGYEPCSVCHPPQITE